MRKIVAWMLIACLTLPYQLLAVDIGGLFNGTSVTTDFGTWDSPRSGSKYFYGGSYRFAFKGQGRMQPLFQGEAPGIKVGCNGFSLSGGFLSLLGIPEIKNMLASSGATLAWGLMMGLEYSMPALAKVFSTLRQWAREIQKLLGDMCSLGHAISSKSNVTAQINQVTNGLAGNLDSMFANLLEGMQGVEKNIKEGFGLSPTNDCSHKTGTAAEGCKAQAGVTAATMVSKISNTNSLNLVSTAIGATARKFDTPTNKIYISKLSSFLVDGKIGDKLVLGNTAERETAMAVILIGRLMFGDIATPMSSIESVMKLTGDASNVANEPQAGTYELNVEKARTTLLSKISESVQEESVGGTMRIQPVINSPEQVAKALIDGISPATQIDYCEENFCSLPDTFVYFMDVAITPDANSSAHAIQTIGNFWNDAKEATLEVRWEGGYIESLKVIRYKIQELTGHAVTFTSGNEATPALKSSTDPTIKIPLLLPNIQKYMNNIAILEKRAKGETPYTAQLKNILARYNAYFFATSIADLMTGRVLDAFGTKGDPVGNPDYKQVESYIREMMAIKESIDAKIKEDMKNQMSYQELAETFENVDKQLKQDLMKDY